MPASVHEQLTALAQAARISILDPPAEAPGRVTRVRLSLPAAADPSAPGVFEPVTTTEVRPFPFDFTQLTKAVRFDVNDVGAIGGVNRNTPLRGGMPIASVAGTLTKITLGDTNEPGLPGSLGDVLGALPVHVTNHSVAERAVAADVRWSFRDVNGNVSFDVDWQIVSESQGARGRGGEVNPAPADVLKPLDIAVPVAFVERADAGAVASRLFVHASVRLVAAGVSSPWVDVPRVEVPRPVVEVPTLLMVFGGKNFEGPCAALVPGDSSLLSNAEVASALQDLHDRLETLFGGSASFPPPLPGLTETLGNITNLAEKIQNTGTFVRAQESRLLKQISLTHTNGQGDPVSAEQTISSLMLVGPPGRRVRFFNARDLIDGAGQMYVTCGSGMFAAVADLGHASPPSVPRAALTVVSRPRDPLGVRALTTFDDAISSLKFEA